jgi:hypothetical protein
MISAFAMGLNDEWTRVSSKSRINVFFPSYSDGYGPK